jgi:pimeloyl-ACP methyl ester carboxylesterase
VPPDVCGIDVAPFLRVSAMSMERSPVAVPIVAGTAIRGLAATVMMNGVLRRHPNAFLVTLERWGVSVRLDESQTYLRREIRAGLLQQNRDPAAPIVLVGHSQGGLAVLRYAVDHPEQVRHVVTVGTPWNGARLAGAVDSVVHTLARRHVPALVDMAPESGFLQALQDDVPVIADRLTNIYSTREILIHPYVAAHIPIPGVRNVLIATESEYERHLATYGETHPVDDLIDARVTHLGEMSSPDVRAVIWRTVNEVASTL